jgi:hypothetical protein
VAPHRLGDDDSGSKLAAGSPVGGRKGRRAAKLRPFLDELAELENRVKGSEATASDHARIVRELLEMTAVARKQQQELENGDLDYRIRCRKERQDAARGWIAIATQAVGVGAMATGTAIGAGAAAGDHRAALGAGAVAGMSGAAGLTARYARRRRRTAQDVEQEPDSTSPPSSR